MKKLVFRPGDAFILHFHLNLVNRCELSMSTSVKGLGLIWQPGMSDELKFMVDAKRAQALYHLKNLLIR